MSAQQQQEEEETQPNKQEKEEEEAAPEELTPVREQTLRARAAELSRLLVLDDVRLAEEIADDGSLSAAVQQQQQRQQKSEEEKLALAEELADVWSELAEGLTGRDGEGALTTALALLHYGQALLVAARLEVDAFGAVIKRSMAKQLENQRRDGSASAAASAVDTGAFGAGAAPGDGEAARRQQEEAEQAQVVEMAQKQQGGTKRKVIDLAGVTVLDDGSADEEDSGDAGADADEQQAWVERMEGRGDTLRGAYEVLEVARTVFEKAAEATAGPVVELASAWRLIGEFFQEVEDYESASESVRSGLTVLDRAGPRVDGDGKALLIAHNRRRSAFHQILSDLALEVRDKDSAVGHLSDARELLQEAAKAADEDSNSAASKALAHAIGEVDELLEGAKRMTENSEETRAELQRLAAEAQQGFDPVEGVEVGSAEDDIQIAPTRKRARIE